MLDCEAQILFMKVDPDAPGTVPGVNHRGWKNVPIRVTKGWNLYVDSELNGKPAQLMIDTGAFTTLIHRLSCGKCASRCGTRPTLPAP